MPETEPAIVIPRYHLPDDWSGKGSCPVCRTTGRLSVQHQDVTPDRMVCGACGTAFEVETAGTRIRLAGAPPALAARMAGLLDTWLAPAELWLMIERAELAATPPAPPAPKAPAPDEPEPGSEDWFASLAAVIGGQLPINPPPNEVLADELERALLNRPAAGGNGAVTPAAASAANTAPLAARAPAPTRTPQPAPAPSVPKLAGPPEVKSADVVLAEAIAALTTANTSASPAPDAPARVVGETAPTQAATPPLPAASAAPSAAPAAPVAAPVDQTVTALPPTPTRRELAERAWKLHEMGNSLASIQGALESSGGTPEDIGLIMAKLIGLEQARQERFRRTLRRGLMAGVSVLFVLLVIAIVLGSFRPAVAPAGQPTAAASGAPSLGTPGPQATGPGATPLASEAAPAATLAYNPIIAFINSVIPGDVKLANGPTPTAAPTSAVLGALFPATATLSPEDRATEAAKMGGLPAWVATLVPSGITIINVPTPSVEASGPPNSPCPSTADQASALFGGPAAAWSFSHDQQGWIFILADKPTNIRVPANMSAGYLVIGQSLEMRSEVGPVTLHNVNFVALSCS